MLICYVCGGETRVISTRELQTFYILKRQIGLKRQVGLKRQIGTIKRRRECLGRGLRANTIERREDDPDELDRSRLENLLKRVRSAIDHVAADLHKAGIPPNEPENPA